MKQSPVKGKLSNFFSNLGSQLEAGQKDRGIFSEKGKAEKKSRKPGESKFKADVRRRQEANKAKRASNKADAEYYGRTEDKAKNSEANRIKPAVTEEPESKGNAHTFSGKKGDKFKYKRKLVNPPWIDEKTGKQSVIDGVKQVGQLEVYEFQRPGSDIWETSKTKAGNEAIESLYWSDDGAHTKDPYYNSPVEKKSPYKKGLGKYAKQAKGSRGYKMKRK